MLCAAWEIALFWGGETQRINFVPRTNNETNPVYDDLVLKKDQRLWKFGEFLVRLVGKLLSHRHLFTFHVNAMSIMHYYPLVLRLCCVCDSLWRSFRGGGGRCRWRLVGCWCYVLHREWAMCCSYTGDYFYIWTFKSHHIPPSPTIFRQSSKYCGLTGQILAQLQLSLVHLLQQPCKHLFCFF